MYANSPERSGADVSTCAPIGLAYTPFEEDGDVPKQGFLDEAVGEIELFERYVPGPAGHDLGDAVDVLWFANRVDQARLQVERD